MKHNKKKKKTEKHWSEPVMPTCWLPPNALNFLPNEVTAAQQWESNAEAKWNEHLSISKYSDITESGVEIDPAACSANKSLVNKVQFLMKWVY